MHNQNANQTKIFIIRPSTDCWRFSVRIFRVEFMIPSKAAPGHHSITSMFDCWYDVLAMKCWGSFMLAVTGHQPSKKSCFSLISPLKTFPKSWGARWACQYWFSLPWMQFLPSFFLTVESWTLTLTEFCRCCSGFFCDLLDESSMHSWSHFGRSGMLLQMCGRCFPSLLYEGWTSYIGGSLDYHDLRDW